ncbi:MAG TPA: 4-hydroxy-tetrahydrodipicolinate reductase [Acidimicrobiaceae bacterium]|nr:4-hydroxy-tetrahydrodipicolinate reductase [Acidimicrobiaceae bacterium]HAX05751.1 4-hydroxy-tetrahydrodipicolinate reductase [Acidimicrobiaceae bacterium]
MRVAVTGSAGRMGSAVCEAVVADRELDLAAAIDPSAPGEQDPTDSVNIVASLDDISSTDIDVLVDFTVADAARGNIQWCAENGVHAVVGTSGLTEDDFSLYRKLFTSSNCLIAPNFAIGAVLLMRFAEMAAPFFPSAEIIELHHDKKVDAPSGTAMETLRRMAEASADWGSDPTEHENLSGSRGGVGDGGISVHSVRLRGLVAHQEVLLGADGETLTLRHDSLDRSSFMGGITRACRVIAEHPGVTVGLDTYLGI